MANELYPGGGGNFSSALNYGAGWGGFGSRFGQDPWGALTGSGGGSLGNAFGGAEGWGGVDWGGVGTGLGIGGAIGNYFGQMKQIGVDEDAYKRAVGTTQRSLMSLLGRGDLIGENANARVVGRDTGGRTFNDRILAPGTILSGGPAGGGIDPRHIRARTMLANLMGQDPFSQQQRQGMYGEQSRQLGMQLGGPTTGNLQGDLMGLMNFGDAGMGRAQLGMQLGETAAQARRQGALGGAQYLGNVYGAAGRAIG